MASPLGAGLGAGAGAAAAKPPPPLAPSRPWSWAQGLVVAYCAVQLVLPLRAFVDGGFQGIEVRVDAWVSLNGRPMQRMIDPDADLMRVRDGIWPAAWILPAPDLPPIKLQHTLAQR